MYILFNELGNITTSIPHGQAVRQGNDFDMYICFPNERKYLNLEPTLKFKIDGAFQIHGVKVESEWGVTFQFTILDVNEAAFGFLPGHTYIMYHYFIDKALGVTAKFGNLEFLVEATIPDSINSNYQGLGTINVIRTIGNSAATSITPTEYDTLMASIRAYAGTYTAYFETDDNYVDIPETDPLRIILSRGQMGIISGSLELLQDGFNNAHAEDYSVTVATADDIDLQSEQVIFGKDAEGDDYEFHLIPTQGGGCSIDIINKGIKDLDSTIRFCSAVKAISPYIIVLNPEDATIYPSGSEGIDISGTVTDISGDITTLSNNATISSISGDITTLNGDIETMNGNIENYTGQIDNFHIESAENVENAASVTGATTVTAANEITGLASRVTNASTVSGNVERIDNATTVNATNGLVLSNSTISEVSGAITTNSGAIATNNGEISGTVSGAITTNSGTIASSTGAIADVSGTITAFTGDIQEVSGTLNSSGTVNATNVSSASSITNATTVSVATTVSEATTVNNATTIGNATTVTNATNVIYSFRRVADGVSSYSLEPNKSYMIVAQYGTTVSLSAFNLSKIGTFFITTGNIIQYENSAIYSFQREEYSAQAVIDGSQLTGAWGNLIGYSPGGSTTPAVMPISSTGGVFSVYELTYA